MVYQGNKEKMSGSFCLGVLKAVGLAWSIIFLMTLLCTVCVNQEYLDFENLNVCLAVTAFLSSLAASFAAGKRANSNRGLASVATVFISFILEIAIGILCFDGLCNSFWIGLVLSIAGCATGIFAQSERSGKRNRPRKIRRYR